MKTQGNLLLVFLGVIIGLLWNGRERKSRTLDELSPTYRQLQRANQSVYDIDSSVLPDYLRKLFGELVQSNLTEHEAERVANELSSVAVGMMAYERMRASKFERMNDRWVDELAEER
ncbi:MAG: hypothetical protein SF029_26880, partial [bacterium]|nr:hypothetical protein [bacterium]